MTLPALCAVVAVALGAGCGPSHHDHDHDHDGDHDHTHESGSAHAPPHGGTPVLIAEDEFHLELVADATTGKLLAYVLDGHLDEYVKVSEGGFQLIANDGTSRESLDFNRVPEAGASDHSEPSSLFEGQADWVKSLKTFEGEIPSITLNGTTFTNITFPYPEGTKHVH